MGEGAFGAVWKVQRYFDEQLYAIKQIRLEFFCFLCFSDRMNVEGQQAIENARGEVILLSSLHHKHIVGYYTAWIEREYSLKCFLSRWGNTLLPSPEEFIW